ncbi:unnamed protein product [Musa acuminata subsp. burmannicoides]
MYMYYIPYSFTGLYVYAPTTTSTTAQLLPAPGTTTCNSDEPLTGSSPDPLDTAFPVSPTSSMAAMMMVVAAVASGVVDRMVVEDNKALVVAAAMVVVAMAVVGLSNHKGTRMDCTCTSSPILVLSATRQLLHERPTPSTRSTCKPRR